MRRDQLSWCGGLLGLVLLAGPAVGGEKIPPRPVGGKITWVYDYHEGKEAARRAGKPMFVVFRCER
jgi:hypothetical protein